LSSSASNVVGADPVGLFLICHLVEAAGGLSRWGPLCGA